MSKSCPIFTKYPGSEIFIFRFLRESSKWGKKWTFWTDLLLNLLDEGYRLGQGRSGRLRQTDH